MNGFLVGAAVFSMHNRAVGHERRVQRGKSATGRFGVVSQVVFEELGRRVHGAFQGRDAGAALRHVAARQRIHVASVDEYQLLAVEITETEALHIPGLHVDAVSLDEFETTFLDRRDASVLPILVARRGETRARERVQRAIAGLIQPLEAVAGKSRA